MKPYVDANPLLVASQSSTAGTLAVKDDRIFRFTPADSLEGVAITALMWADGIRAVVPVGAPTRGTRGCTPRPPPAWRRSAAPPGAGWSTPPRARTTRRQCP